MRPLLNGTVNFPLMLAPMVGLTHVSFRNVVRSYLPQGARTLWPTEMLNSRRVPHEPFGLTPETLRDQDETDLCPQILANEEEPIRRSVERLKFDWGASAIDINMGCPVRKALSHNYGVALMGDKNYARDVVSMVRANTDLPIGVKLRNQGVGGDLGAGAQIEQLLEFSRSLIEGGANWLTLHPRTAEQKRRGRADWSQIAVLRSNVTVPVIGNGDIQIWSDIDMMLAETQCDAVMVGRALTARPFLFWQWGEAHGWAAPKGRENERAPKTPEEEAQELGRSLLSLIAELRKNHPLDRAGAKWTESLLLRKFRFHLRNCCPWLDFGLHLESRVAKAQTLRDAEREVRQFFAGEVRMNERTELRY